jgi:hypothetical protein
MAQFTSDGSQSPRETLVRRFAFRLMDVRGVGTVERVRRGARIKRAPEA